MDPVIRSALAAAGFAALAAVATAVDAQAAFVDYLHVEANEGNSSGGHVALRLGDRAYDFQHRSPGVLRLHRHDADDFAYDYAFLQNRPIHVRRIEVDEEVLDMLRERFNRRYLAEQARFEALDVLTADRRLLEAYAHPGRPGAIPGHSRATDMVELRGAGYFHSSGEQLPDTATAGAPSRNPPSEGRSSSPALLDLRGRVEAKLGRDWIDRRLEKERRALVALEPGVLPAASLNVEPDGYPPTESSFSRRYIDLSTAVAALQVLKQAPSPREEAVLSGRGPDFVLSALEIASFEAFADRLGDDLVDLLSSQRADWGQAMLVGMARLDVARRSVDSGRLVVLDTWPDASDSVPLEAVLATGALDSLADDARSQLAEARSRFTPGTGQAPAAGSDKANGRRAASPGEADYTAVEAATNRCHEVLASAAHKRPLRISPDLLLPSRGAAFPLVARADAGSARFAAAASQAGRLERDYAERLRRTGAYDLLRRNCVSGLFEMIDEVLRDVGATNALGGRLAPGGAARIVPFLSAESVDRRLRVVARFELPSWREQKLADLGVRQSRLAVALRESNTLTSTIYRPHSPDSFFLMFADRPGLRPLTGAVNLLAATGASAAGVLSLPVRGRAPLVAALRGILFSLPELGFVQIRRGTFAHVGRREARLPGWW